MASKVALQEVVEVMKETHIDPANVTAPAPGKKERQLSGYVVCDLCNVIVGNERNNADGAFTALHCKVEHAEVPHYISQEFVDTLRAQLQQVATDGAGDHGKAAVTEPESDVQFGHFVQRRVSYSDRGPEVFQAIQNAASQLHLVLHDTMVEQPSVYLFGSCVAMGIWDGSGDMDCTAAPESDKPLTYRQEQQLVGGMAYKLRNSGFTYEELEPVTRTRVPVLRRETSAGGQRAWAAHRHVGDYKIVFSFSNKEVLQQFEEGKERMLFYLFQAKRVMDPAPPSQGRRGASLTRTYALKDGSRAIRLFSRREDGGVTKMWAQGERLPEIFSMSFDLSCRTFGLRNSWFLRAYMEQDPVFRVGNQFLKDWSKKCGLNCSRRGYLTSYAMSNLWVYYLLREGHATFVDPLSISEKPQPEMLKVPYMALWPKAASDAAEHERFQRLGALTRGFFNFYATFDWKDTVVSLKKDCGPQAVAADPTAITRKADLGWETSENVDSLILRDRLLYHVCIEDVYEENLNLGRHLTDTKAAWVKLQFLRGALALAQGQRDLLLDQPQKRAAETVRLAAFRHLVQCGGSATTAALHAALAADATLAQLLATMQLTARFSDVWCDLPQRHFDAQQDEVYQRRGRETTCTHPMRCDEWAMVCEDRLFPPSPAATPTPDGKPSTGEETPADAHTVPEPAHAGQRVIRLAKRGLNYALAEGDEEPAYVGNDKSLAEALAATTDGLKKTEAQMRRDPQAALLGVRLEDPTALLGALLFRVDHRLFERFEAAEAFRAHLSALALLLEPEAVEHDAALLKTLSTHARGGAITAEAAAAVAELLCARTPATATVLCRELVEGILVDADYVQLAEGGVQLVPTPLLCRHSPQSGAAELEVERRKTAVLYAKPQPQRQQPSSPASRRSLRDHSKTRVGMCMECRKNNVLTFPALNVKADSGWYCIACWDKYEK